MPLTRSSHSQKLDSRMDSPTNWVVLGQGPQISSGCRQENRGIGALRISMSTLQRNPCDGQSLNRVFITPQHFGSALLFELSTRADPAWVSISPGAFCPVVHQYHTAAAPEVAVLDC